MAKVPFVTKEQLDEIVKKYPTPSDGFLYSALNHTFTQNGRFG